MTESTKKRNMTAEHLTSDYYSLLAGLLAMPSLESLAVLTELAQEYSWLQPAVDELQRTTLSHWQAEHTRLFINGHPKTCCPPFASVYRHGVMNGHICLQIVQFYERLGLQPIEGLSADYLGALLESAAYLLAQPQHNTELWEQLWQHYLANWVPQFAQDLQQHSELILYRQLGQQLQHLF